MLHPVHAPATLAPAWIALPPWALSNCIVAAVGRCTVGVGLAPEQRLSHYPTTPYVSLNAIFQGHIEMADDPGVELYGPIWRSTGLSLAGPQTVPRTSRMSEPCHGLMVLFYPEAWQALTGMSAGDWTDRWAEPDWPHTVHQVCMALWQGHNDEARLENFLPNSRPCGSAAVACTGPSNGRLPTPCTPGRRPWPCVQHKPTSGAACGRRNADQSHLIRAVREVTGFSPQALQAGLWAQEPFWIYRAWAQLRGLSVTPPSSH